VFTAFFLSGIAVASWTSRLPVLRVDLDLDVTGTGVVVTAVPVGGFVGVLLASHILSRFGARATVRTAMLTMAIGLGALGVAAGILHSVPLAIASFAVFGLGNSTAIIAINVEAAALEKVRGRTMLPLFHATWSVGGFAGAGVGAAASALALPLPVQFGATAAAILVVVLILSPALPKNVTLQANAPSTARDRFGVWREPRTLLIALVVLGFAFVEGAANNWLAVGMVDDRGVDAATAALFVSAFTGAMTFGRATGGRLVDRIGRVAALRLSMVLAIAGVLIVAFVPVPGIAAAAVLLWGLGAALGNPLAMSAAADDPRNAAGRVAAVSTVGSIANLSGPTIIGLVGGQIGVLHAFLVPSAIIAVAFLATGAMRPPGSARPARP
jgi:MFS family permease